MQALNIAGTIFMVAVWVVGAGVKHHTKKRLKDIDGLGKCHTREDDRNRTIWL